MFDFDAGKLVLIGIVALIVIGPKDLPRVLRELGRAVGKMRRMAADFQGQFMEAVREADMADIKADVAKLADSARVDIPFDPLADIRKEIKGAVGGSAGNLSPPADVVMQAMPAASLAAPSPDTPDASAGEPDAAVAIGAAISTHDDGPRGVDGQNDDEAKLRAARLPASGVDAEMQALARALEDEMRAPSRLEAADAAGAQRGAEQSTSQSNA